MYKTIIVVLVLCIQVLIVAEEPGVERDLDLLKAGFPGTEEGSRGTRFVFEMGSERRNWNHARWSHINFPETRDWSNYRGLRLRIHSEEPRSDVSVSIALREDDGSWHYVAAACDLVREENVAEILFRDFRPALWVSPPQGNHLDDNQVLDQDRLNGLAVGVVNAQGIGEVSFSLVSLELLPMRQEDLPQPVTIMVTGRTMDINGTEMVPGGLFGHFPGGGTREMRIGSHREIFRSYLRDGGREAHPLAEDPATAVLIDVMGGDRYQPSMRLTREDWQEHCRNMGLNIGRALARFYEDHQRPEIAIEWWNEPYLNWSNRTRRNFNPSYFDQSQAIEGGPVHLTVDGSVAPFLRWTQDVDAPPWLWMNREHWRAGRDADGREYRHRRYAPPPEVADGETYTARDKELTAFTPWHVYDETQFTFWSGRSQLMMYNEPMLAFARGLKEAYPEAVFLAGWDFRVSEDNWAAWDMLYKPTIDAGIRYIDGVTDHDYGGDVTRMPANYEFVTAYGMTRHNKWLLNYNTECGENSDPSAYPDATASMRQAGKRWLKAMWSARKLVHAVATVPDKARSFTFHWFDQQAEGATFMALRTLRGRLVQARSDDPDVFVAASIDGTDPLLPRPDYLTPGYEMTIAVFNDHPDAREITIPIQAPSGSQFTSLMERRTRSTVLTSRDEDQTQKVNQGIVVVDEVEHALEGDSYTWSGELAGGHLLVLTLPLSAPGPDYAQVQQRQFFAMPLLENVSHDNPVSTELALPKDQLANADRALLRLVVEGVSEGEASVRINDQDLSIPRANTPVEVSWIRDIPLDLDWLTTENELVFSGHQERAGWLLVKASIILEGPAPAPEQ